MSGPMIIYIAINTIGYTSVYISFGLYKIRTDIELLLSYFYFACIYCVLFILTLYFHPRYPKGDNM